MLTAATAHGECYVRVFDGDGGSEPRIADMGRYEDEIVREDGEWHFARRAFIFDYHRVT
jgi:hypothetical protein